ncbi:hypothetical protein AB205_0092720, partial [Aquarana catesbeiana]
AHVLIANTFLKIGDSPYTHQYGGCGEQGRFIHLTPDFLTNEDLISVYGAHGKLFVREWARFRWGVFEEYSTDQPFYISPNLQVEATRYVFIYFPTRCKETIIQMYPNRRNAILFSFTMQTVATVPIHYLWRCFFNLSHQNPLRTSQTTSLLLCAQCWKAGLGFLCAQVQIQPKIQAEIGPETVNEDALDPCCKPLRAAVCSVNISGIYRVLENVEDSCLTKICNLDPDTGLYEQQCTFFPEKNQIAGESIMYFPGLQSVSTMTVHDCL